jgi:hypothetical protein
MKLFQAVVETSSPPPPPPPPEGGGGGEKDELPWSRVHNDAIGRRR